MNTIKETFLMLILVSMASFSFSQGTTPFPLQGTYTLNSTDNQSFNQVKIENDTLYFMHNNVISSQFLIVENLKGLTFKVQFFATPTNSLGNDFFLHIDEYTEQSAIITLNYPDYSKQLHLSK